MVVSFPLRHVLLELLITYTIKSDDIIGGAWRSSDQTATLIKQNGATSGLGIPSRKESYTGLRRTSCVILQPHMDLVLHFAREGEELASERCQFFRLFGSSEPRQIKVEEPKFPTRCMEGG